MGIENQNLRKSSRIRERAHRLLSRSPYFISPARIPYHERICTFGLFEHLQPLSRDISLIRPSAPSITTTEMADEARFNNIEGDVGALKTDVGVLKTDVGAINQKLDHLIQGLADMQPAPDTGSNATADPNTTTGQEGAPGNTQPAKTTATQPQQPSNQQAPAQRPSVPHNVRRQMSLEDYVQREMDRDKFQYQATGKNIFINDINSARIISKPYMYLYQEGVNTVKQRLECRYSMTAMEYVDATLALLSDTHAYDPLDYQDIICHLRKVSCDSLERPWHGSPVVAAYMGRN